ncbi:hypothetical protein NL676_031518 [Syzygium grande]|nr:hypothetical protein NL676_031518 [Syzygium grande]
MRRSTSELNNDPPKPHEAHTCGAARRITGFGSRAGSPRIFELRVVFGGALFLSPRNPRWTGSLASKSGGNEPCGSPTLPPQCARPRAPRAVLGPHALCIDCKSPALTPRARLRGGEIPFIVHLSTGFGLRSRSSLTAAFERPGIFTSGPRDRYESRKFATARDATRAGRARPAPLPFGAVGCAGGRAERANSWHK